MIIEADFDTVVFTFCTAQIKTHHIDRNAGRDGSKHKKYLARGVFARTYISMWHIQREKSSSCALRHIIVPPLGFFKLNEFYWKTSEYFQPINNLHLLKLKPFLTPIQRHDDDFHESHNNNLRVTRKLIGKLHNDWPFDTWPDDDGCVMISNVWIVPTTGSTIKIDVTQ